MSKPDVIAFVSRAAITLFALPLLVIGICVVTYAFVLMLSTVMLLGTPHALTLLWSELKFVPSLFCVAVVLAAIHHREKSS